MAWALLKVPAKKIMLVLLKRQVDGQSECPFCVDMNLILGHKVLAKLLVASMCPLGFGRRLKLSI